MMKLVKPEGKAGGMRGTAGGGVKCMQRSRERNGSRLLVGSYASWRQWREKVLKEKHQKENYRGVGWLSQLGSDSSYQLRS